MIQQRMSNIAVQGKHRIMLTIPAVKFFLFTALNELLGQLFHLTDVHSLFELYYCNSKGIGKVWLF